MLLVKVIIMVIGFVLGYWLVLFKKCDVLVMSVIEA